MEENSLKTYNVMYYVCIQDTRYLLLMEESTGKH